MCLADRDVGVPAYSIMLRTVRQRQAGVEPQPSTESAFKRTSTLTRLNGFAVPEGEFIHPLALRNMSY